VVDFEYASPNPAAFDIANHFHEWTADYHSSTPHILNPSRYPSCDERRNFYRAYFEHSTGPVPFTGRIPESKIQQLDKQVRVWSPASHAMWALWGIVQSREDLEGAGPDFDYIGYAQSRLEGFRRQIKELGIQ
jgi:choline kinase